MESEYRNENLGAAVRGGTLGIGMAARKPEAYGAQQSAVAQKQGIGGLPAELLKMEAVLGQRLQGILYRVAAIRDCVVGPVPGKDENSDTPAPSSFVEQQVSALHRLDSIAEHIEGIVGHLADTFGVS